MRPDVKLGVVVSMMIVSVAGGYYLYRDRSAGRIPVSMDPKALAGHPSTSDDERSIPATQGDPMGSSSKPAGKKRSKGPVAKSPSGSPRQANRSSPSSPTKRLDPRKATATSKQPQPSRNMPSKLATDDAKRSGAGRSAGKASTNPTIARSKKKSTLPANRTGVPVDARLVRGARKANRGATNKTADPAVSKRPVPLSAGQPKTKISSSGVATDIHRVQPGDTFTSLAQGYYGDAKYAGFLRSSNPQLNGTARLTVGSMIKIPPRPTGPMLLAKQPKKRRVDVKSASQRFYTVKPRDSFYKIARDQLGDAKRWEELFELNKALVHGDARKLQPGQKVRLPN